MKKVLFGIVCFRERFWECDSFISLLNAYNSSGSYDDINVFVFDNTDFDDWKLQPPDLSANIKLNYASFINNPGIAFAYNFIADFANSNNFEWMVFLDQDSLLPTNAYQVYVNYTLLNSEGIAVPKVESKNKLISPSKYEYYRTSPLLNSIEKSLKLEKITCINSGLMISVSSFLSIGGYNEKLRLDFCDHEFIERASAKINYLNLLDFTLHQDFSTDTNELDKSIFRYKLFLADLETYKKIHDGNFLISLRVDLPHLLRLTFQYKTFKFLKVRFRNFHFSNTDRFRAAKLP